MRKIPIHKIIKFIRPQVSIGGLDIGDLSLTYVTKSKEGESRTYSVRLAPGVISSGVVANAEKFIHALKELHGAITAHAQKRISVVVTLSDANIYTQTFALPRLKGKDFQGAVRLNMQTISPIDFENSYHDYEVMGRDESSQIEFLASFVERKLIDDLVELLDRASFSVVAIEQRALSVSRVIHTLSSTFKENASYFVLYVDGDGLSFSVMRKGVLYFNRFSPWSSVRGDSGGRQISFQDFKDIVGNEGHRVVNYYTNRFSETISGIYVIAPGIQEQVENIITSEFSYPLEKLVLKSYSQGTSSLAALGAMLRGEIPRSKDHQISVAPEGTEERFFHTQILVFVGFWKAILAVVFFVLIATYTVLFGFLGNYAQKLEGDLSLLAGGYNITQLKTLQKEAEEFNSYVSRALQAKSQQTQWASALSDIYEAAGVSIEIARISIQNATSPVVINARAANEQQAVAFKDRLSGLSYVRDADLPLVDINQLSQSRISFRITFYLNRLNF